MGPLGYSVGTPRDPAQRGSHVSLKHPEGWRINRALIDELHVIPDFREPDNVRIGLTPLYTTFEEVGALGGNLTLLENLCRGLFTRTSLRIN